MTPEFFLNCALRPALVLLPAELDSPAARAMILAICLQESRLQHRRQIKGPARGYAQFELGGGVRGVLNHPATKPHIQRVLAALDYPPTADAARCWELIEHNDVLAAAFARLLLWTLPDRLPGRTEPNEGWDQYIEAWRPGKPHRDTWDVCYARAWATIEG